ncbi:MAG: hypothetical protein AVO35_11235 [Candidatus Aegiribacteria sp. MLS_C]|nr:MAG: hypothetical protein AVO35_11235 [Candidatus Aegiribacteria sp. MLS_C]
MFREVFFPGVEDDMIQVLCIAMVLTVPHDDFLDELDEQYRSMVMEIIPSDYGSVGTGTLMEEAAVIAGSVYSTGAGAIHDLAVELTAMLPAVDQGILDGMVQRDGVDIQALGLMRLLAEQGTGDLDGYLYLLRFWDPAIAAGYTKSIMLARSLPPGEYGGRTIAERLVPDRYYYLDGDYASPVIAIVSLRDLFTVKLVLQESGCFLPVRFIWYE